jgi:AcrR family transcriptional regulator
VANEEVAPSSDEEDNLRARLVFATYVVIAKSGYHDATVSRIARRADCSPGAIYKLYRSKQDLVLEAFGTVFGVSQTATALRASSGLAEILSPTSDHRIGRRNVFALETVVAAAHIDAFRAAVASFLADPGHQIPEGFDLDDASFAKSRACIHSIAVLTHGVEWMSAITASDPPNFTEYSEVVRVAHHL